MSFGFRIVDCREKADPALVRAFAELPTAIVSDNMNRMSAGGAPLRPMHKSGGMAGVALTVRTRPGDNLMIHKALEMAAPGDILVCDGGGDVTNSLIGELLVSYARTKGVAGFVINGAVRDMDALGAGTFPIFAIGVTHRGPYKDGPGEINVPVSFGGMVIEPGDIVIGDMDGMLAIPKAEAPEILAAAQAQKAREGEAMKAIANGTWDRAWIDATLSAKGVKAPSA